MLWQLLIVSGLVAVSQCYKDGAPVHIFPKLCEHMNPKGYKDSGHNFTAQTHPSPFVILPEVTSCCSEDESVNVTVKAETLYFEGLLLLARKKGTKENVGTFSTTDPVLKAVKCGTKDNSALTHSTEAHYTEKNVLWKPDADFDGEVEFVATMVKGKDTFWLDVKSEAFAVKTGTSGAETHRVQTTFIFAMFTLVLAALFQ
jgi:hypothetical protein